MSDGRMEDHYQLFPALDPATEAALRASIQRFGVLVPVSVDQHGQVLDGHHRRRIAAALGVDCPIIVRNVADDDEATEIARTLNMDRRHLSPEDRRRMVEALRSDGHSLRAIAGALGVSHPTVMGDLRSIGKELPMPERIRTSDGRSYPARRPSREEAEQLTHDIRGRIDELSRLGIDIRHESPDERQQAVDLVADWLVDADKSASEVPGKWDTTAHWQMEQAWERARAEAEAIVSEVGTQEEDLEVAVGELLESKRLPITKPDLGDGLSHPARYSDDLLPHFAELLAGCVHILDPFAGTGKIHELQADGFKTVGIEIEPEWANLHPDTTVGSALALPFADDSFDAICTSPTYGNRLADSHNASDPHLRRSYTHDLGRTLHEENSGAMQWGLDYQAFHEKAWAEAVRVLRPGGVFVLNIKDHIRNGAWQDVAGWHMATLCDLGLTVFAVRPVLTGHLRQGANATVRVPAELVIAFDKKDER